VACLVAWTRDERREEGGGWRYLAKRERGRINYHPREIQQSFDP